MKNFVWDVVFCYFHRATVPRKGSLHLVTLIWLKISSRQNVFGLVLDLNLRPHLRCYLFTIWKCSAVNVNYVLLCVQLHQKESALRAELAAELAGKEQQLTELTEQRDELQARLTAAHAELSSRRPSIPQCKPEVQLNMTQ